MILTRRSTSSLLLLLAACSKPVPVPVPKAPELPVSAVQATVLLTDQTGAAMAETQATVQASPASTAARVTVHIDQERQTFLGVGGSLTQASAAALSTLSPEKRSEVLAAYFGEDGARYALSRTHIGSSDFTEYSYSYHPEADDTLAGFSIEEDRKNGLLALLKDARDVPGADFRLISSPWTAPAWMKDNGKLYESEKGRGGRLLPEHYETFSRYFVKYLQAYAAEGIEVWAITPVNEPQGNAGTWESMEMSPEEQRDFLRVLGPQLADNGLDPKVLIFDQNRAEMAEYTEIIFTDEAASSVADGTAVHWYNSTFKVYEDILDAQHARFPDKLIIQSEGTIDSVSGEASCNDACPNLPCGCEPLYAWWQDDPWYWKKEATDWGWDWAADREVDHPRYAPAFRYSRDLVVGMGHWLDGWVDWNLVLDKRGGPNHVGNYCLAPVMVDGETDTVYYTPLFYVLKQVSRHSRPGGVVLNTTVSAPDDLHAAAIRNPDGTLAVHVFNEGEAAVDYAIDLGEQHLALTSPAASLQTVVFPAAR